MSTNTTIALSNTETLAADLVALKSRIEELTAQKPQTAETKTLLADLRRRREQLRYDIGKIEKAHQAELARIAREAEEASARVEADKKAKEQARREASARAEIERKAWIAGQTMDTIDVTIVEVERAQASARKVLAEAKGLRNLAKAGTSEDRQFAGQETDRAQRALDLVEKNLRELKEHRKVLVKADRQAKAEAARVAKLEAERLAAEAEADRLATERLAREERERLAREQAAIRLREAEEARVRAEAEAKAGREAARLEADRKAKLTSYQDRLDQATRQGDQAEVDFWSAKIRELGGTPVELKANPVMAAAMANPKGAQLDALRERLAREEAGRKAIKAAEEAARLEAEQKAKAEAEAKAKAEAERKAAELEARRKEGEALKLAEGLEKLGNRFKSGAHLNPGRPLVTIRPAARP